MVGKAHRRTQFSFSVMQCRAQPVDALPTLRSVLGLQECITAPATRVRGSFKEQP